MKPMAPDPGATTLEGRIERVTYSNPQTHYMIARLRVAEQRTLVTVLGHMPEPQPGETLRLTGVWQTHARYGQQFQVQTCEVLLPAGVEAIQRYLESGIIQGIGPRMAGRLIRHFQDQTLAVIEHSPQRLAEVKGIGEQTARRIAQAWQEHHAMRALMNFLQARGVKPAHAVRVYKQYGAEALQILETDPYRVTDDLPRIGFPIADAVARHSERPPDPGQRAAACVLHLLESAGDDGHMFIPRDELLSRCDSDFGLDYHIVQAALKNLSESRRIRIDNQAPGPPVYAGALFEAETRIARRLQAMLALPAARVPVESDQITAAVVRRLAIQLSEAQLAVLQSVLRHRVVIITGGPGTGKTTLIRSLAAVYDALGRTCLLAAPTGRAARRMAQVTGRPAVTLHKLLEYNLAEGCFGRDQDNPLDAEAVIVDEASMVDALLMGQLIQAVPLQARLILVGDVFQLPSVGPGTVLADLIASGAVETFELQEIFRQAAQSPIIVGAHGVRQGRLPCLEPLAEGAPLAEFTFLARSDPQQIARTVVDLCRREIPRQLGLDGVRDVQVLTPMHKGPVGTLDLNRLLQAELNPRRPDLPSVAGIFRLGDKVMHLRNNYQKEVFNGEIGVLTGTDAENGRLVVTYDGREVVYDPSDLDELTLAYAISVHKSQGSEYPIVILPMVTQHYIMLQRNLLYTALTRAQHMVILIGSAKAVRIAVQADTPRRRRTLLAWRINPDAPGGS